MLAPPETCFPESVSCLQSILDETLDPSDWPDFRAQAHRMLDDMLDYTEHIRERPVWQRIPQPVRDAFLEPLPQKPAGLGVYS
jgi:hypothetical protein